MTSHNLPLRSPNSSRWAGYAKFCVFLMILFFALDLRAQVPAGSVHFMAFGPDAVKGTMTISSAGRIAASWSAPRGSRIVGNGSINLRTGRGYLRTVGGDSRTYDLSLRTRTQTFTSGTAVKRNSGVRWTFWGVP